ncbi:putative PLAC8 motif-containing protein [Lupinus albus]|uniref:Putative PLAC8 motif-containing protein n=1 Tax=Lupinus albus TaxID=3870 RepID=A0A6A4NE00_LUPAL|nr:putative PLAC8 motif-containing protein [Lupinus albus]
MSIKTSEEKGEMQNTEDQEIQQNEPVDSITPSYEADMIGNPWNIGLFDCHENEANATMTSCVTFGQIAGWNGILEKQHTKQQDHQTLKNPPSDQVM